MKQKREGNNHIYQEEKGKHCDNHQHRPDKPSIIRVD